MEIGKNVSGNFAQLLPQLANRHGLIAGATGTGKTFTLKKIAEEFSRIGVPCFLADVKGDISGICQPGSINPKLEQILNNRGIDTPNFEGFPTVFWDLYGKTGHPIRTTVSEFGPILLSRILDLNQTQTSVLSVIFKIADDNQLMLDDLKDLKAILTYVGENSQSYKLEYGNISPTTLATIQRNVLAVEEQGVGEFFGEPAFEILDFIKNTNDRGNINLLNANKLMQSPKLYSTFLLWMLSELFEKLPEVGDVDQPKLVFFFDEAHLLFDDTPDTLVDKILQVVRLIRSKGVGIYFITQNPIDIPDNVLGQLGNRVQHALRAFTPKEQKAIRQAADTYRSNTNIDISRVVQELEVGEALISFLDAKGSPVVVDRYFILPPSSSSNPLSSELLNQTLVNSEFYTKYQNRIDDESAYELLRERYKTRAESQNNPKTKNETKRPTKSRRDSTLQAFAKSTLRSIGSQLGREITRGVLGGLFGKK